VSSEEHEGPVVRDRRRIDPETGKVRQPSPPQEKTGAPSEGGGADKAASAQAETTGTPAEAREQGVVDQVAELKEQLEERTNDLKRLQAEFVNYKRRQDREKQAIRELATAAVLTELLPVVDDIGRAREHGELEGGFKAVAEALESTLTKLGLVRYGEVGDRFDPRVHEALMHAYSDDVDGPTCSAVLQPGYRMGERILRPARVAVAEPTVALPAEEKQQPAGAPAGEPGDGQDQAGSAAGEEPQAGAGQADEATPQDRDRAGEAGNQTQDRPDSQHRDAGSDERP